MFKSAFQRLSLTQLASINGLLALWFASVTNMTFLQHIWQLTPHHTVKSVIFLITSFVLLWAYLNFFLQLMTWSKLARPVQTLLLFFAASGTYAINSFGVVIDVNQIQNLMETDTQEMLDLFLNINVLLYLMLLFVFPCYFVWRKPLIRQSLLSHLKHKLAFMSVSLIIIISILGLFYVDYAAIFRENRSLRYLVNPVNSVNAFYNYWHTHQPLADKALVAYGVDAKHTANPTQKPVLLVFVLGETARAQSFALNGYSRPTNPLLSKQAIINFSQVSSCGTTTAVSLPCLFSGFNRKDYDENTAHHREGLLDIIQRAGYKVTWIENNSGCKGVCDRVEQFPVLEDKKAQWCKENECVDDLLLNTFQLFLAQAESKNRAIFLHQEGSHGPAYYLRYPKEFEKFNPACNTNAIQGCSTQAVINTYDNTILYTDYILSSIIDELKNYQDKYQIVFWYVSDHGESTGEHGLYLHGTPYFLAPTQQTHVPMLTWLSADFSQNQPAKNQCLQRQQHQAVSHDNVFHTMLGLLEIKTAVYQQDLDMSRCQ
ncbi:MAG: phosphoethanolamine--lipid A transferase [Moraxellaceae bacterium]|nr:phosphoethanolamine--lipid A transferase [Moraxellaceae bacterium]